jgi:hypothetical protein
MRCIHGTVAGHCRVVCMGAHDALAERAVHDCIRQHRCSVRASCGSGRVRAHVNAPTRTVHWYQCVDGCTLRELLYVHRYVCPCVLCVRATAYCRRDEHGFVRTSGPVDVALCRRCGQTAVARVREHTCTVHTRLRVFTCGENIDSRFTRHAYV